MSARRTALVTGVSRGIGAGIAAALRADGWEILAPSRQVLDLRSESSVEDYLSSLKVPVDGVVLSAGINEPAPLGELQQATYHTIQQVNVGSNFLLVSELVPSMADRGFGRVLAVTSAYAVRARSGRSAYSTSKAALEALIRTVAVEFGAQGVIANCVAPGFVDTDLTRTNNDEAAIHRILERVPVGRLAEVPEVGRAAAFLMSTENRYITGQTLAIDGGFLCT